MFMNNKALSSSFLVRFQRRSPGDTTLSELRQPEVLLKVGTISYNWSTIGAEGRACVMIEVCV
jgi:hypothetical protein